MTLTLAPETEARLLRFATSRGLAPEKALEELLDAVEEEEELNLPLKTIPAILTKATSDEINAALKEMDSGQWIAGSDFLAGLRKPLDD